MTTKSPSATRRSILWHEAARRGFQDHKCRGNGMKRHESTYGVTTANARADAAWIGAFYSMAEADTVDSVEEAEADAEEKLAASSPHMWRAEWEQAECESARCTQVGDLINLIRSQIEFETAKQVTDDNRASRERKLNELNLLLRSTITAALRLLLEQGVIEIRHGRFVVPSDYDYTVVDGLSEIGIVEGDPFRRTSNYDGSAAVETDGYAGMSVSRNPYALGMVRESRPAPRSARP